MNTELVTYEEKNVQMSMLEVISIIVIIFGMGICLAYTYKKTNNLLVPIGIHLLNNLFYLLVNFQL